MSYAEILAHAGSISGELAWAIEAAAAAGEVIKNGAGQLRGSESGNNYGAELRSGVADRRVKNRPGGGNSRQPRRSRQAGGLGSGCTPIDFAGSRWCVCESAGAADRSLSR